MNIDEFVTKEQFDEIRTVDNFDNNAILNKRWNKVDELLSTFYTKNQKINRKMYDNLQSIFDGIKFSYEDLYNFASTSDIAKLRRKIDEVKDEYGLDGYVGYRLSEYSRRKKLSNQQLLLAYITIEYYKQLKEQDKQEQSLFDEIKNVVYKESSIETRIVLEKKLPEKKLPEKKVDYEMPKVDWLGIILGIGYNGFKWFDFKDGNTVYNANKLYELIVIHLQQDKSINIEDDDIQKLLNKQERAYLHKTEREKTYEDYKNDFSGNLDNQIAFLVNQIALQGIKKQGCKKVQFVAVIDDKTTKMCDSLNGQIFDIYDYNKYYRYSDYDKKEVLYTTKGLETGANLPPINNHFHYCRSTIIPYR